MSFFAELKRRNVLRVAAVYIVAAWLVIQVVETIFPIYGLSNAAIRLVITLLSIGFVPIVVVAWVFELTPEGLKLDKDVDRSQSISAKTGKTLDRAIMVVLALALGYFAFDKFVLSESREATIAETARREGRTEALVESYGDKSIAVLPFVNMSSDPEQEYFADGISEEMLNLLARIPQLRVISRSSAFSFKGKDVDVPTIAEQLQVAHILEGSVRKSGNNIRITAQLVEARSDTHLWSATYDRSLEDIFAIQDEVAAQVVVQLRLTLLDGPPTATPVDPVAYALYLQAHQIVSLQRADELAKAERLLKQALDIDPDYVDALLELGHVYSTQRRMIAPERRQELTALMEDLGARVMALDPDNPTLRSVMAWELMTAGNDLNGATKMFEEAIDVDPSNSMALLGSAVAAGSLGRTDLAIEISEYLVARDPLEFWGHLNLAGYYFNAGRVDDALGRFEIAIGLNANAGAVRWKTGLARLMSGDPSGALVDFELEQGPAYQLHGFALAFHDLGREEESAAAFRELVDREAEIWPHGLARAYAWVGNADEAFRYLELTAEQGAGQLGGAGTNPLFRNLHDDPRWLPFLQSVGQAPEQLAAIEFDVRPPE
jgi:TolB-like protein/Tfp pilus assembly protein PilF